MTYAIINKSQVEIRLSNIDQAKEFLKKNPNCKSQILSDNQVVLIYPIDQTQRMTSLIKPAYMTLNKRTNEKTKQKICGLNAPSATSDRKKRSSWINP